jgi:hypothetical protein
VPQSAKYNKDVFINCPFDDQFKASFDALVFAVYACGFRVRCAREVEDGSETRITKLYRIIEQSRLGIHDISRTQTDKKSRLPRFNMPLELGIFLGAKSYGDDAQRKKQCIIFDVEPLRYQKFVSDLAGMDITAHGNDPRKMVAKVRDWLMNVSRRKKIPSSAEVLGSYDRFVMALPGLAKSAGSDPKEISYADYERFVLAWVRRGGAV